LHPIGIFPGSRSVVYYASFALSTSISTFMAIFNSSMVTTSPYL